MSNYKSSDVSFDSLFMKYTIGDKEIDTGYKFYDSVTNTYRDISSRYQVYRIGNKVPSINFKTIRNNTIVDISTLYQNSNQPLIQGSFNSYIKEDDPTTITKCKIIFIINVLNVSRYDVKYLRITNSDGDKTQITESFVCDANTTMDSFDVNVDGTRFPDVYNPTVTVYNILNESITFSCVDVSLVKKYSIRNVFAIGGGGGGGGGGRNVNGDDPDGGDGGGGGGGAIEFLDVFIPYGDPIVFTMSIGTGGVGASEQSIGFGYGNDGEVGGTTIVYLNGNIILSALGGGFGIGGGNNFNRSVQYDRGIGGKGGISSKISGANGNDGNKRNPNFPNIPGYLYDMGGDNLPLLPSLYNSLSAVHSGNGGNGGGGGEKYSNGGAGGYGSSGYVDIGGSGSYYC